MDTGPVLECLTRASRTLHGQDTHGNCDKGSGTVLEFLCLIRVRHHTDTAPFFYLGGGGGGGGVLSVLPPGCSFVRESNLFIIFT
ncbi:Uncharacterized protein M6B38_215435 [Iris pallida]|uniref:Uncharacterized protein n=1 Tax=Iris pallida TaxID=29817 RepID=A0AAX6E1Q0_IRIPA|nr:Uncharacterized protein M6B38_215435 [Iris pallida]